MTYDEKLNVRLTSEIKNRLEAAAKDQRRKVGDLARIILEDWAGSVHVEMRETPTPYRTKPKTKRP